MRIAFWSVGALALSAALPAMAQTIAIAGGVVLDGTGAPAIENGVVIVRDGKIACVGSVGDCAAPEAEIVDASGRYVLPGLVDTHVHLGQTGWLDARPDGFPAPDIYPYERTVAELRDDPRRFPLAYLCSGVTAVLDVGGLMSGLAAARTESAREGGLRIRAAGPMISNLAVTALNLPGDPAFLPMNSPEEARAAVAKVADAGADVVKVLFAPPAAKDRDRIDASVMAAGAAAREARLAFVVHAMTLREAKVALRAGANMLMHSVSDRPIDDEFLSLLMANDAAYAPTLIVVGNWTRALASVVFQTPAIIDDANGCVDEKLRDRINAVEPLRGALPASFTADLMYRELMRVGAERATAAANLRRVEEAGGRVVAATDAGNPLTLHGASINSELEAIEAAGIAPAEIIVMATRNGAIAMGASDEFGTLEVGKAADMIFLSDDPRVSARAFRALTHVMRGGNLWTQEELRRR